VLDGSTRFERSYSFQAQCLIAHVDFLLLQRLARPMQLASVRYPGIPILDSRLLKVFLPGSSTVGGRTAGPRAPAPWTALEHRAVVKQAVEHGTNGGDASFEAKPLERCSLVNFPSTISSTRIAWNAPKAWQQNRAGMESSLLLHPIGSALECDP
jgi:hypothetical protein